MGLERQRNPPWQHSKPQIMLPQSRQHYMYRLRFHPLRVTPRAKQPKLATILLDNMPVTSDRPPTIPQLDLPRRVRNPHNTTPDNLIPPTQPRQAALASQHGTHAHAPRSPLPVRDPLPPADQPHPGTRARLLNLDHRQNGSGDGCVGRVRVPAPSSFDFDQPVAQLGGQAAGNVLCAPAAAPAALGGERVRERVLRARGGRRLGCPEARRPVEGGVGGGGGLRSRGRVAR